MVDDVPGDQLKALARADDGFELRPLGLELFFPVNFLALGRFFEVRVDLRPLRLIEFELG